MNLVFHLSIHLFFALLAGVIVWRIWKKPLVSFGAGILGGFLIDADHFIDYFLAFGLTFNPEYFTAGYSFLKSDKLYILFHGWEYGLMFLVLAWFFKNKTAKSLFLALGLGILFHLSADVVIDQVPPRSYLIVYRAKNKFNLEKLVYPDHWQAHLEKKKEMNF